MARPQDDERPLPTARLFILGAGFSKAAGMPLASELLPLVLDVAARYFRSKGFSHLEHALERYDAYVADVEPGRQFDLEEFGAWLDWEHTLRMKGSDTFSDHGNQAGLQLRWAIAKVLHDAMPRSLPDVYLDFARQLTTTDRVLSLNYDLIVERSCEEVGLPYRRFPSRYSEVHEWYAVGDPDEPDELVIGKLHGSIDWLYRAGRDRQIETLPLVDGPRVQDDPLLNVEVIGSNELESYYSTPSNWFKDPPVLMPPSRAKPLAASELVPLWDGAGLYSYMLGGLTVIGCSLPPGDPYMVQLMHHIATDYVAGREAGGRVWPQRRLKVVDLRPSSDAVDELRTRFRFMDPAHTDFIFEGFTPQSLDSIFEPPDLFPPNQEKSGA
ncbi:MAG: hypothetical protein ACXVFI_19255 [Solirubrobacteraceae bacterium]